MPNENPQTVILRFRDLVTKTGETIQNHRAIIEKADGYVWWGWWNKYGEKVPAATMISLNKFARENGPIRIFLLDTGTLSLFEANLIEIKFDTSGRMIGPPEVDKTPEYYNKMEFYAWFKLEGISENSIEEVSLHAYSYLEIDDFFVSGKSHFDIFKDKMVYSFEELRNQDRTIWFCRSFRVGDRSSEILLFDSIVTKPENFSEQFRAKKQNQILWLTDLHFGPSHRFPTEKQNQKRPLWLALEQACKDLDLNIGMVIISGDVTMYGKEAGYEHAEKLIANLSTSLQLKPQDFLIIPGNHDFGFAEDPLTPQVAEREEVPDVLVPETYDRAQQFFKTFYSKIFNITPNEFYSSGRKLLVGNQFPVELIGLNSVRLQQYGEEFQGYGYVGNDQLRYAAEKYSWKEGKVPPYRIAVLHHHLVPVTYTEPTTSKSRYSLTLDTEAIIRWMIEHEVFLVLHGHMHQPSWTAISRPAMLSKDGHSVDNLPTVNILGLGSTGINVQDSGELKKNTFGVLTFLDRAVETAFYEIHPEVPTDKKDHLISKIKIELP